MNTESNAMNEVPLESQAMAPAVISAVDPMYYLVRRELWENRSVYIAPLAVAGLFLAGFLISLIGFPSRMRAASALDALKQHELVAQPYLMVSGMLMLTTLAVGVFYCLDALYGERRDRSILFWKSLPVSDVATVLSKAITPIVIMPLVNFGITVVAQWIMMLASSAVLLASGMSAAPLWRHAALIQTWLGLLYHLLTVHGLWYAPIYGWLLLVSAWARRAPFLWAGLPLLAIAGVEKIAFNTTRFGALLLNRMSGGGSGEDYPTVSMSMDPLMHFSGAQFFLSPGLWIGLAMTAVFLGAAVRLRRSQGPI
jgi:ABC-2 type transport system permease protein